MKSNRVAKKTLQLLQRKMESTLRQVIIKGGNTKSSILEIPVKWQLQNVTNIKENNLLSQDMNWVIRKFEKEIIELLSISASKKSASYFPVEENKW